MTVNQTYPTEMVPMTFKFSPAFVSNSTSILSARVHRIPSCPTTDSNNSSLGIGVSFGQNVTSHLKEDHSKWK